MSNTNSWKILDDAKDILNKRRASYMQDKPSTIMCTRIARAWSDTFGVEITPEMVPLAMIDLKLVRVKLKDTPEYDDLVDIIGYASVLSDVIENGQESAIEAKQGLASPTCSIA